MEHSFDLCFAEIFVGKTGQGGHFWSCWFANVQYVLSWTESGVGDGVEVGCLNAKPTKLSRILASRLIPGPEFSRVLAGRYKKLIYWDLSLGGSMLYLVMMRKCQLIFNLEHVENERQDPEYLI